MATFAERGVIKRDALLNPFTAEFVAPTDSSVTAVQAAVVFYRRVQSALEDVAYDVLSAAETENDLVIWSRKVIAGEISGQSALRLVLAETDAVSPANLANVTDAQIKTFLASVAPIMSAGIRK